MNIYVVVCRRSPQGVWFEGESGSTVDRRQTGAPGVTLPMASELHSGRQALTGYFFCSWGEGWIFNDNRVQHGCPMVLWAKPGVPVLHWVARIELMDRRGIPPTGSLRLVGNPDQPGAIQGGLSALSNSRHVDLPELGLPDELGGWTVGGQMGVQVPGEGMLAVRLQGICRNVRVLWSAISQAHFE